MMFFKCNKLLFFFFSRSTSFFFDDVNFLVCFFLSFTFLYIFYFRFFYQVSLYFLSLFLIVLIYNHNSMIYLRANAYFWTFLRIDTGSSWSDSHRESGWWKVDYVENVFLTTTLSLLIKITGLHLLVKIFHRDRKQAKMQNQTWLIYEKIVLRR